jgi:hypothetical protein
MNLIGGFRIIDPRSKYLNRFLSSIKGKYPAFFVLRIGLSAMLVAAALLIAVRVSPAQDDEKTKIPGLDKIISNNEHLCFTGSVKSVDEKHNIMSVNSVEGADTEIFPIKHGTHVETADGFRKRLDTLTPGTRVIVYYDQRSDHRTVTRIELYDSETKKKEPHS